jgi:putative peptidoglycan binding protein
MSSRHTVMQGEHLSRIAADHGFGSIGPIWDHPENAELKQRRGNPSVLAAGDEVFIPNKLKKSHRVQTGHTAQFRVREPTVVLRFRLLDPFGNPMADTPCELEAGGQVFPLVSDGDGRIEQKVRIRAERGTLRVGDDLELEIRIGHLDPIDTPAGLQARLNNLGFFVGDPGGQGLGDVDPEKLAFAIELFQGLNGLPVDGQASQEVLDKIKELHGC